MRCSGMICVAVLALVASTAVSMFRLTQAAESPSEAAIRQRSQQALQDSNWADALAGFRQLLTDPSTSADELPNDLKSAVSCLQQLGRHAEFDGLIEETLAVQTDNWQVFLQAARLYRDTVHHGYIVSGEFERGGQRGIGRPVNSFERDHVRALQLLDQAWKLAVKSGAPADSVRIILEDYARTFLTRMQHEGNWVFERLTDLESLPDFEDGHWHGFRGGHGGGAPVDAAGQPVFYDVPKTYDAAASDGERWRWLLTAAGDSVPAWRSHYQMEYADFLRQQFGVQTLASYGWWDIRDPDEQDGKAARYSVHTLSDEETIARLADGVRRFQLPAEHNYLRIYRTLAEQDAATAKLARTRLAEIYENRRQYPKAAAEWRQLISRYEGSGYLQKRLDQIVGNWGEFEPASSQAAGRAAVVDYRYRNARTVTFTAFPIDIETLLTDVKSYLSSSPQKIDWQTVQLGQIGHRIVTGNQQKYVGERVAQWTLKLNPPADHSDRRITVRTPLQQPGAYLLEASLADGNTSRIVLWVEDTVIVRKPLDGAIMYYVADAAGGEPVSGANVEFFGWKSEIQQNPRRHIVRTRNFAEFTDENGIVRIGSAADRREFQNLQWLTIARSEQGRLAFLGFDRVWLGHRQNRNVQSPRAYLITDRPVYRPGQTVQFKFWVRQPQYDQPDVSRFAGRTFQIVITDPKGEKVLQRAVTLDSYGGAAADFPLDEKATLGNWSIQLAGLGGGQFRVEEYRKPEFEVTIDAPASQAKLGEKIEATIRAKYYFGAPVTNARVKYKVLRSPHDSRWFPQDEWDWLYGRGYWWFGYDYDWYPGWSLWGCQPPTPWWLPAPNEPPEVVAEAVADIGPDGSLDIVIDTELARVMHGDQNHRYEITAEVTDASRRTIVGRGEVLATREPFRVFVWLDRGHYQAGDTVTASFQAQTIDGKPVSGTGEMTLFKVDYIHAGRTDGKPREEAIETWTIESDEGGRTRVPVKIIEPGQYRLSCRITDADGQSAEGGCLFNVTGSDFSGNTYRFNDLELIPDRKSYRAGETVRLMINSARRNATVLLFLRPEHGVYPLPRLIRLNGRSQVVEFAVARRDMPNFHVEALTVFDARIHTEIRQLAVPPEKRVLQVEVLPSAQRYEPGETASMTIRLTDNAGHPFAGSTAVSVYDRSVEYISGGSNVPDIRSFFWKWRRHHHPQTRSNLDQPSMPLFKPGEQRMSPVGVFGNLVPGGSSLFKTAQFKNRGIGGVNRRFAADRSSADHGFPVNQLMVGQTLEAATPASGAIAESAGDAREPAIRSSFADTACWNAALTTDENGLATVKFTMPDDLTAWKIRVWGMGHGTRTGEGTAEVITAKNLLVRLQAPRFFVERDEVVLTANVHNYLGTDQTVDVSLETEGDTLQLLDASPGQQITVPAGGERRVDWRVRVAAEGEALVRMKALSEEASDAIEMSFPCYVHGMLKTESYSGVVRRDEASQKITIQVPAERRPDQSRVEIRYSPTLAGALTDALPYLVHYPYGCTEQTLNRFVPTVIAHQILQDMKLDLHAVRDRRTNLNAQQTGEDQDHGRRWKLWNRNPVFDTDEVTRMVRSGVERLTSMQNPDGGWGWFSGFGERSYAHTTAVVVHGLNMAERNGAALVPGTLERGIEWLKRYQAGELQKLHNGRQQPYVEPWKAHVTDLDALVFYTLVENSGTRSEIESLLYHDRVHLSVYGKILLALTMTGPDHSDRLDMLRQNIEQFAVDDPANQTSYLQLPAGTSWWTWYGNDLEANAWYLKLLAATDPHGKRAAGVAKYLLNNRRNGSYWRSTRDTAYCVEALADFLRASGEDRPDMTIRILVDGQVRKSVRINESNLFSFDNRLVLAGDELTTGDHTIEVQRQGSGPLYFNAYAENFTREEFITGTGLDISIERRCYRLRKITRSADVRGGRGQAVTQQSEEYEREPLDDLAVVNSGDLIEVELQIHCRNDFEYLMFEDLKAAGFEPVDVRSGYTGNELGAYVEYRDEKVAMFVRHLPRGRHSVRYRLRAETPGRFHALPARASAMYAPELRANSDEIRIQITDP